MEVLPKQLASKLGDSVRLNTPVAGIQMLDEGLWMVNREEFTDVLIAIPTHAQTELNAPFDLDSFSEIYYPPVASLSLGFGLNQFTHPLNGFGMLIPKIEDRFSLGALFPSSIFSGRAPGGMALLTVFIGGSQSPERALMDEDDMVANALKDLEDLLGLDGKPDFTHLSVWPKAIPQYVVGYEKHLNRMKQIEEEHPGIHFAGHYRDGISVANSILSGLNVAERIMGTTD